MPSSDISGIDFMTGRFMRDIGDGVMATFQLVMAPNGSIGARRLKDAELIDQLPDDEQPGRGQFDISGLDQM